MRAVVCLKRDESPIPERLIDDAEDTVSRLNTCHVILQLSDITNQIGQVSPTEKRMLFIRSLTLQHCKQSRAPHVAAGKYRAGHFRYF